MSLVLTRSPHQEVIMTDKNNGYKISVKVHRVRGNQVQLAFEAPNFVDIDRDEIYQLKYNTQN